MTFKVVKVTGGCCTGLINPGKVEKAINAMVSQGWKFETMQIAMGCCSFQNAILCFSKQE